jgi:hypothetical protein
MLSPSGVTLILSPGRPGLPKTVLGVAAGYPEVKPARREICPHKSPSGVIVQTERLFGPIVLGWRLNHTVSSAVKEGHAALVGPLCLGWTNAG